MNNSKTNAVPSAEAASAALSSIKSGEFSFPKGIVIHLNATLAQSHGASFCTTVRPSSILETRLLSIFSPKKHVFVENIYFIPKGQGRFSRDRPIIVSEQKSELYLWTGQGRQTFIIPLLPDEYERARCKHLTPEQCESEVRVEVAAIPPDQCPVIDPEIPKKPQAYNDLNPEMIECFLRFKKGLPVRQRSVTVARCQSEITALQAGHNASDMYQLWFVGMKVAIQPHQRSNIPRTNIDHNHLEALLTRAGYTFDDFGNLVDGDDDDDKTIEPLPQQLPMVIEEVHVDHLTVASEVAPIEVVTAVQETTVTTDTDWQSLSLGSILGSIDVISVLQAQLNTLEENVNLQTQTVQDARKLLDREEQKLTQLQGQLAACRDEANKTPLLSLLQTGDARNHLKELVDFLNQLMK